MNEAEQAAMENGDEVPTLGDDDIANYYEDIESQKELDKERLYF